MWCLCHISMQSDIKFMLLDILDLIIIPDQLITSNILDAVLS